MAKKKDASETVDVTIQKVSEMLGVDREGAAGLVRFLRQKGIAQEVGTEEKKPNQRGKGSKIFQVPKVVTVEF